MNATPPFRRGDVQVGQLPPVAVPAVYVHVPFCLHKCHYCDFYSITRQGEGRMRRFVDLVLAEAAMWCGAGGPTVRPQTVFFGGGTPTMLTLPLMRRLIEGLRVRFDFSNLEECTIEANPATVDLEYCRMLLDLGVDRLSFGAQSFNRSELATLRRRHDPDDVPRSIEIARQAGFERLNVDLIYAIPQQTLESWQRSLESAIALKLSHYSCYALTYEPDTPIAVKKRMGLIRPASEELELAMLWLARRRLAEVGCPAYEISNYAAPGEQCRQNLVYWTGRSYVGLGPSAASHLEGHRFKNRPHLGEWEQAIESGRLPTVDYEVLSPRQRAGELAMLLLRLSRGVDFDEFAGCTGLDGRELFAPQIEHLTRLGLVEVGQRGFRLTDRGLNVADAVTSEFLTVCDTE